MPNGIGKTAALRRRAIHESPLRGGAAWIEMKPVGNAVPGIPGDRKGRPYGVGVYLCAGAGWSLQAGTAERSMPVPYIGSPVGAGH